MAQWIETKLRYDKVMENGVVKKVTEAYLVDAISFAEAEERIRTIAAPQNVARHPGFRTPCARTGVCSDCNSPDRVCNTRMEMLRCWPAGRVLVVLIDQELGL